ncbi:MAG: hypothetical protein JRI99_01855 [Deltaproteobacteria bacterium]|nr:hypothetical protein [Deltaproteobacteria bacterium]
MKKIIIPILAVLVLLVGYKFFFSRPAVRNSQLTGSFAYSFNYYPLTLAITGGR